jgi:hypothetical protein
MSLPGRLSQLLRRQTLRRLLQPALMSDEPRVPIQLCGERRRELKLWQIRSGMLPTHNREYASDNGVSSRSQVLGLSDQSPCGSISCQSLVLALHEPQPR